MSTHAFVVRRGLLAAVAFVAALVAMPAAAQQAGLQRPTDAKLIAAAKADGSLTVYSSSSVASLKADADAFQKAYGVTVNFTQMTSGPMAARVDQEVKAGRINADILITADFRSLQRWAGAGQLAKLPDVKFPDRTDTMVPIQSIYQSLFYNTAGLKKEEVPRTWTDLLSPKFTGKIILGSPRIGPAYATQYYALLKDPKFGEAFFQKLAAQKPRIVQTPALVAQLVASGEGLVGFVGIPYDAMNIVTANPGAPINYTYLDPITTARTFLGINNGAQKPNAARLFAMWLMSPEGQVAHNGENRASSLLGNLPGTLAAPDLTRVRSDISVANVEPELKDIIAFFDRTFR